MLLKKTGFLLSLNERNHVQMNVLRSCVFVVFAKLTYHLIGGIYSDSVAFRLVTYFTTQLVGMRNRKCL